MKIVININDNFICSIKKIFSKKNILIFILILSVITPLIIYAASITKPYTFSSGQVISSSQVNQNFDVLYAKVNSMDSIISNSISSSNGVWNRTGDEIYYTNGNVGIKTVDPDYDLDVNGNLRVTGTIYGTATDLNGTACVSLSELEFDPVTEGELVTSLDSLVEVNGDTMTGSLNFNNVANDITTGNGQHLALMPNNGNVGIGTNVPARKLHINDVMRLQPRSSAPSSPLEGDIYMDSGTHKLRVYDGTTWQDCW